MLGRFGDNSEVVLALFAEPLIDRIVVPTLEAALVLESARLWISATPLREI